MKKGTDSRIDIKRSRVSVPSWHTERRKAGPVLFAGRREGQQVVLRHRVGRRRNKREPRPFFITTDTNRGRHGGAEGMKDVSC